MEFVFNLVRQGPGQSQRINAEEVFGATDKGVPPHQLRRYAREGKFGLLAA